MKIGVLTSSRADYSIYYPLLSELQKDNFFKVSIIAFGTHLSGDHGFTVDEIVKDGFDVSIRVPMVLKGDSPGSIAEAMGATIKSFVDVWENYKFDFVLCLGDRYEMFAACASSMPFNTRLCHLHGGEQTLGAFDDAFRNAITHMSVVHFTSTWQYRERVIQLKGDDSNVFNVGALSIDNLKHLQLLSIDDFRQRFGIDLSIPSILMTFHPETIEFQKNESYINEILEALRAIEGYQFIITMPNADTMGIMVREKITSFIKDCSHAIGVESFGTVGYLSCMQHCTFMMGNTSSGFVEASFFPKYVINLGARQEGRIVTENICNTPIKKEAILQAVLKYPTLKLPDTINVYGDGTAAKKIINILKKLL